jgi:hypothetical protein
MAWLRICCECSPAPIFGHVYRSIRRQSVFESGGAATRYRTGIVSPERLVKIGMMRRPKLWAHNNFVTRARDESDDVNDNMTPRQRFTFLEQEGRRNAERETQKLMETDEFKEWQKKKERAKRWAWMQQGKRVVGASVLVVLLAWIVLASGSVDGYVPEVVQQWV